MKIILKEYLVRASNFQVRYLHKRGKSVRIVTQGVWNQAKTILTEMQITNAQNDFHTKKIAYEFLDAQFLTK